jgi:hypothetical protein
LPPGEGGGLFIRAPRELCADNTNEFHLHHRVEIGGEAAVQFVVELPAGRSSCEWQISDLAEGEYEALIQVAASGRTIARTETQVVKGVTGLVTLRVQELEIQGYVTSGGRPRSDLFLSVQAAGPVWLPDPNPAVTTNMDGWYDIKVPDQSHQYNVSLSAQRSANHLRKYVEFFGGLQRLDLEIAPGIIHVIVPPFAAPDGSQWAQVNLRAKKWSSLSDTLATPGGGVSFNPRNGFRGDYIGLLYGDYVISLTLGNDSPDTGAVVSVPVTLSAQDATVEVTLSSEAR